MHSVFKVDLFSAVCTLRLTVPCHLFLTCVTCSKVYCDSVSLLFCVYVSYVLLCHMNKELELKYGYK